MADERLDLEAIKARAAYLWSGDFDCPTCDFCVECMHLIPCAAHNDNDDIPALLAEVERLRACYEEAEAKGDALRAELEWMRKELLVAHETRAELLAKAAGHSP